MPSGRELYRRRRPSLRNRLAWLLGYPMITRRLQMPSVLEALDLGPDHVVLDVGSGLGFYAAEIAARVRTAIAIDVDRDLLRWLPRVPAFGAGLHACAGDALALPVAAGSADRVLLSGTLQSVDAGACLRECARVLRPGGLLVLTLLGAHRLIERLYRRARSRPGGWSARLLRRRGLPETYEDFRAAYRSRQLMTRYYPAEEIEAVLAPHGFRLRTLSYAPAGLAAVLLDAHHLLTWRSDRPLLGDRRFFAAAYPLFLLAQTISGRRRRGNEYVACFVRE